jgi:teichuronic acid biosynthesis glycosyltransferase TuaH
MNTGLRSDEMPASSADGMARTTLWLSAAQAMSLGLGFVVWAYAARVLRTAKFGEIQIGIAIGTYLALLATVGLVPLGIAEFRKQLEPRRYVAQLQRIRVTHTLLIFAGLGAAAWAMPSIVPFAVVAAAASVVVRQLWPEWADIALGAARRVVLVRVVYFAAVLAATVLLVAGPRDASRFGAILAGAAVVAMAPAWFLTRRQLRASSLSPPDEKEAPKVNWPVQWRRTMRRAVPLGAGDVLGQLLANADLLMLGALATTQAVAFYGAAYRIIFAIQGVGVALRYASLRVLASHVGTHEQREEFEQRLIRLTLLAATAAAAAAVVVSHEVIAAVYGSNYASSTPLLRVLVWTWPLDFAGAIALNFLIVRGRRRHYVTAMGTAAGVNVAANALVIRNFGAIGAAVVIVLSLALLLVMALRFGGYSAGWSLVGVGLLITVGFGSSAFGSRVPADVLVAVCVTVAVAAGAALARMLWPRRAIRTPDQSLHLYRERWLFLLHVDWRWIRQRPHWFVDEARKDHEVVVAYRLHPRREALPLNASGVRRFPMLPLPLSRSLSYPNASAMLFLLQRLWIAAMTRRFAPTHVYISHPKVFATVPRRLIENAVLIYDCMDDAVAMANHRQRKAILRLETELAAAADVVVVSSQVLLDRLSDRLPADVRAKAVVVRNGASAGAAARPHRRPESAEGGVRVGYAGTVASWFDFESVLTALDGCPGVRLRVIGPRTGREPNHPHIQYVPPVDHSALPTLLGDCDALIMPFTPGQVVTAVNPVKLYEYLAYRKPIIARRYPEIECEFDSLVEFYDTPTELMALFSKLEARTLPVRGEDTVVRRFIAASSWSARWQAVQAAQGLSLR